METQNLTDEQFYRLIEEVVARVKGGKRDKWIDGEEAMKYMRITSKTTLQKLRDTGVIRYTQPLPKHILYDLDSIDAYLDKHAKNPF
ncbi:helix-turn-helix domain-containing protein [Dyadobacter sp. CY356]|uniref:helix-turn-helix domain-containing protein n=1 Tax=Dyadobacter sp. CY356 TaxID=2906442 RepID=UPI001F1A47C2|nr:helix-turn-helix domain-containing protein [Dyadobacter sp. CY356]MCF0055559.1 helix-turn-helix domain-containing protein [Dyadobacter sp. CY356]